MKGWVAAEAKSVELYRWLEQTARQWKDGNAALWDTPNLEYAMQWKQKEQPSARWAMRYGGDFPLAMEFLGKSKDDAAVGLTVPARRFLESLGKKKRSRRK